MNNIIINSMLELQKIIQSPMMITGNCKYAQEETEINMWAILKGEKKIDASLNEILFFILQFQTKIEILAQKSEVNSPITFYLWFDEQIGQLCFNSISCDKQNLPFDCKISLLESADSIIDNFLHSDLYAGIIDQTITPCDVMIENFSKLEDEEEDNETFYVIDVFAITINE